MRCTLVQSCIVQKVRHKRTGIYVSTVAHGPEVDTHTHTYAKREASICALQYTLSELVLSALPIRCAIWRHKDGDMRCMRLG